MAKHILFILHGMGHNPEGWSAGIQTALKDASKRYPAFDNRELTDRVLFKELRYDQVFDRFRTALADNADGVVSDVPETASWARPVFQELVDQRPGSQGDQFAWSHAADVALYRLMPNVHNEVLAVLKSQVSQFLADNDFSATSLLAHSLGTCVGHDLLAVMADPPDASLDPWRRGSHQFRSYFALANTSRLLQTDPKSFESFVKPGPRSDSNSYVARYLNFRHKLDPVPLTWPFDPTQSWQNDRYDYVEINHILDKNIHGYEHYLAHPMVHSSIINRLYRSRKIDDANIHTAMNGWFRDQQVQVLQDFGQPLTAYLQELGAANAPMGTWEHLQTGEMFGKFFSRLTDYFMKVA